MCKVVNVRGNKRFGSNPNEVYIGRANPSYGLAGSKFGNPFQSGRDGNLETVLAKYKNHLWKMTQSGEVTLDELAELDGKDLGCWCKPKGCHGDVLVKAIRWAVKEVEQRQWREGYTCPSCGNDIMVPVNISQEETKICDSCNM